MEKPGRNDTCPCGSGKKFKKCCENRMIGNRFLASKVQTKQMSGVTSFFQNRMSQPAPSLSNRKITVTTAGKGIAVQQQANTQPTPPLIHSQNEISENKTEETLSSSTNS